MTKIQKPKSKLIIKNPFNTEIDTLFEKLISEKNKGIRHIEDIKNSITQKLDIKIAELYKKRDFITEIFTRKKELKLHKQGVISKLLKTEFSLILRYFISIPFIYIMVIPTIIFHAVLEIYHNVCFRLYKIPIVKARDYFIFDRRHLPYLNWLEKINCAYCSYYNCLIAYAREIGGRTEQYWCPIKHSINRKDAHSHYNKFIDYSNGESLREEWNKLREFKNNK